MKKIFPLAIALSLVIPVAYAAPKGIQVQLGSIYSAPASAEGVLQSGKTSIYFGNITDKNSDIQVTAVDLSGNQLWQRVIDSGSDEVVTAAALDPLGNIWLAGASAPTPIAETPTVTTGIDNPDQVVVDNGETLRGDLTQITIWKVSSAGELIGTYSIAEKSIPQVTAISASNSGISLVGSIDSNPFLITMTSAGVFGKLISIATNKSEINSVIRNPDGSTFIIGSSSETLAGKKVAGIRDGILAKVSKTGAVTSLLRSSAKKALRSWISADSSLLLSGPVVTGKVVETAITKFTPTFTPTWTLRVPSAGPSIAISANGNSYLAFTSRAPISGIANWKPAQPSLLILTFDSKGVIKAATALPGLVTPISLQYSRERGVIGLAAGGDGTVSIFTLVSR